ncbi:MAG: aminotransferase class I/II-fold pyridoxal phosphate-dependent enzyme, partial [Rhodopirellula sp. JB044]|uniref:aminotransferase class I/II-fold pyridoxal phosphate-dependent enzyme n=1 Tax=Rhodopirellula sp. JB044 TaxID=3342844 RepID=UPI00370A867A
LSLIDRLGDLDLVVVDESFIDFVDQEDHPSLVHDVVDRENVVVLKSLGKNFGLHGVRFGYAVTNRAMASVLRKALPKWNINSLAEQIIFSLGDNMDAYHDSIRKIADDRTYMMDRLRLLPDVEVLPSQGNFIMMHLPIGCNAAECRDELLTNRGLFIRECGNKAGIDGRYIRAAVRNRHDVDRLVEGLGAFLDASGSQACSLPLKANASNGLRPSLPSTTA